MSSTIHFVASRSRDRTVSSLIRSLACCMALSAGQRARNVTGRVPARPGERTSRWWKPRKSNPGPPTSRCTIRVLAAFGSNPSPASTSTRRATAGPEPERAVQHVRLENRLQHDLHRGLHDPVPHRRNRQRPALAHDTRLGDEHPPGRQRTIPPLPQLGSQLVEQPGHPVLLDLSQRGLVDARSAVVPAHRDPPAPPHVLAEDLVEQRVEPPPGIGLGRPVQRMLQGTDRIPNSRSRNGGTSRTGTHRAPPPQHHAPTKQRPFPHRRLCCPVGSIGTTAASDAHPARCPLPGVNRLLDATLQRHLAPRVTGPGRASPVPAATIDAFRAPYAGESFTAALQAPHRFHGLHPEIGGSDSLFPTLPGRTFNDAAGFASCYGPHPRSPQRGFRRWASTHPVSRPSRQPATGPPGSYPDRTLTGRRRRAYEREDQPLNTQLHLPPCWAHDRTTLSSGLPGRAAHLDDQLH